MITLKYPRTLKRKKPHVLPAHFFLEFRLICDRAGGVTPPEPIAAAMTGRLCGRHSNPGVEAQPEPEPVSRVLSDAHALTPRRK